MRLRCFALQVRGQAASHPALPEDVLQTGQLEQGCVSLWAGNKTGRTRTGTPPPRSTAAPLPETTRHEEEHVGGRQARSGARSLGDGQPGTKESRGAHQAGTTRPLHQRVDTAGEGATRSELGGPGNTGGQCQGPCPWGILSPNVHSRRGRATQQVRDAGPSSASSADVPSVLREKKSDRHAVGRPNADARNTTLEEGQWGGREAGEEAAKPTVR